MNSVDESSSWHIKQAKWGKTFCDVKVIIENNESKSLDKIQKLP